MFPSDTLIAISELYDAPALDLGVEGAFTDGLISFTERSAAMDEIDDAVMVCRACNERNVWPHSVVMLPSGIHDFTYGNCAQGHSVIERFRYLTSAA